MGVPASGATLEIQLVADVARLQRDMKAMQDVVGSATAGAGKSFNQLSAGSAAAATKLAANAQAAARAAVGMSVGVKGVGAASGLAAYQAQNLAFQLNDVVTGLASGQAPMRVLAQQSGQFVQIMQQSGLGVRGFVRALLEMVGVITVTRDAELAEAAAQKAAAAQAVRSRAERAAATLEARNADVALAQAQLAAADTAEAEAAAQSRLVKALRAAEIQAGKTTIANNALAAANAEAAAAANASNAKTVVGLGRVGIALGAVGLVAGVAWAGIKSFQDQVARSGELDKFAEGLRLTDAQIEKAGGKVKYMADGTREISGLTVSWGNIAQATWQVVAERAGLSSKSISDGFTAALNWIAGLGKFTIGVLLAGFAALIRLIAATAVNMGRLATGNLDKLTNPLKDMKDQFFKTFDDVNAGFDKIGKRALELQKAQLQAQSDTNKPPKAPKPKKQNDHGLAEALAELDANIKGQYRLAAAYQVSDAAAMKAEALQKAEEQAIRHKGDVGLFYEKELALAVATRAADGAKQVADLRYEADARAAVNGQVAAGLIPASQAGQALELETKLRPLTAAASLAEGANKKILVDIIRNLTKAYEDNNVQIARETALKELASKDDEIAKLQLETQLIGASNRERAVRLAQLEAEQFIKNNNIAPEDQGALKQRYIDAANAAATLQEAQDNYNRSLSYTADLMQLMSDRASTVASILSDGFGDAGNSIGSVLTALADYQSAQADIDKERAEAATKAGGYAKLTAEQEMMFSKKSANAQVAAIGSTLGALKGLFKEHSTGYKVMTAIEKAYAIFQAAQTALAIARDIAHTISSVANSGTRTAANTAEGGSKIFAQLGVWAFPVVAAMIAVLAALGAKGGGGGSGVAPPTSADDLQAAAGTGTVLGDSKAKSESIAHSLEIVASNTNKDLEYSNAMLKALRSIDTSIAKMAGTVARQIQVAGSLFDTSRLNLGTSGSGGFLGIGKKTTTRSLYDLGLTLNAATVADIIADGITGQTYQIVQKVKEKSGFLGIGGGTSTSYQTTYGTIDPEITAAIQEVITNLRNGLVEASKVIGLEGAEAILDSFNVRIGKVSFKDMTGEQIEDQLNAIFSSIGDQMAGKLLPALKDVQKVGEGLFETFIRVAREYQVVDVALESIGKTFGAVGVDSVAARDALVQLFGSLDDFVSQTDFFKEQFLTDAEQVAPVQAAVIAELARLGVSGVTTRDQFKQLVLGLDLTTDAGRQMYASLLALAPGFDTVLDYFDELNKKQVDTLQQQIDQFNQLAASLQKYRDTLFQTDASQASYAALRSRFVSTANLAATGDATALGGLQNAGQDFLNAAKNNASSLQDYYRDVALVARGVDKGIFAATETADYAQLQLDALKNATSILQSISDNTAATASALAADVSSAAAAASGSPVPTPSSKDVVAASAAAVPATATTPSGAAMVSDGELNGSVADLRAEMEGLREDLNAALQAIAINTGHTDRLLSRWDRGDTIGVTVDGEDPVDVNLASWGGPGAGS